MATTVGRIVYIFGELERTLPIAHNPKQVIIYFQNKMHYRTTITNLQLTSATADGRMLANKATIAIAENTTTRNRHIFSSTDLQRYSLKML